MYVNYFEIYGFLQLYWLEKNTQKIVKKTPQKNTEKWCLRGCELPIFHHKLHLYTTLEVVFFPTFTSGIRW